MSLVRQLPAAALLFSMAAACPASHTSAPSGRQERAAETMGPAPVALTIKELHVDPAKTVRVRGVISSILAVDHVPAKVVLKITDSTETITVVINKPVALRQGAQLELIGRYRKLPSPTHKGSGEPPHEAVFEVERFLDLR